MKQKTLTTALLLAMASLVVHGPALAQVTGGTSTDANNNTTAGPCTNTYGASAGGNLTLCTGGSSSNFGTYASGNIVIGSTTIAGSDPTAPNSSNNNISIGIGNTIGNVGGNGGTGWGNVILGSQIALGGASNVAIGTQALNGTNGSGGVAVGAGALSGSTLLNNGLMTAVGSNAGVGIKSAESSGLIGSQAGYGAQSMMMSDVVGEYAGTFGSYASSQMFGANAGNAATLNSSIAIGTSAASQAALTNSIAIGSSAGSFSSGSNNLYIGPNQGMRVTGNDNTLVGAPMPYPPAPISQATSLGSGAAVSSNAVAIGYNADACAEGSVVIGSGANDNDVAGSTVIGQNASIASGLTGSNVAIGTGTVVSAAAVPVAGVTLAGNSYSFAGATPAGVVGLGNAGAERQLTGVAAGQLSAASTDAVNGSQLYATNQAVTQLASDALLWSPTLGAYDASHGTGTPQKISNLAAGTAPTDAVNVSQLDAVAAGGANAVLYDDASHQSVTLGGVGASTPVALGNVAAGAVSLTSTSAVNGSQLFGLGSSLASALGGGSSFAGGTWTAPSFTIQGASYNNVGDALHAVDQNITNLYTDISNIPAGATGPAGPSGPAGPTGPTGPTGPAGPSGSGSTGADANAVVYDSADKTSVTLGGQGSSQAVTVHNVAAGQAGNDAVNVSQLDTVTQQAIQQANTYTDTAASQTLSSANSYTDRAIGNLADQFNDRFNRLDRKINQTCSMSTAMSQMAMAGAGAGVDGRVAAGVGLCSGGSGAVSVGYATQLGDRGHMNFGAAFTGGQGTVGAGFGIDL